MRGSNLIGVVLLGVGLTGAAFAQTMAPIPAEVKPANLFAVLSYLFPGFDPLCINRDDKSKPKTMVKSFLSTRGGLVESLGKECYSLNFDLGFMNNKLDGKTLPAAKLKFGF